MFRYPLDRIGFKPRILIGMLKNKIGPSILSADFGALADSVHEVLELEPSQIEEPPKIGARLRSEFIKGIGKRDDQFIIILDLNRFFSASELALVQEEDEVAPEPEMMAAAG